MSIGAWGKVSLTKLQAHLLYLSKELFALALFDPLVAVEENKQILTVSGLQQVSYIRWTPTASYGINQHTAVLPEVAPGRRLLLCRSVDLAGEGKPSDSGGISDGDSCH